MDLLGILFTLYILFALVSGASGVAMLSLNRSNSQTQTATIKRGHFFLAPLYLLLLVGTWNGISVWYADATHYIPTRTDLIGNYVIDKENSDAYVESKAFLSLNADSTYSLAGTLITPSRGTWAMPNQESPPFEPALVLSRRDDFYSVVIIRESQGFHLGVQGTDPDDLSVAALKKTKQ
jgi:hypothetical protein